MDERGEKRLAKLGEKRNIELARWWSISQDKLDQFLNSPEASHYFQPREITAIKMYYGLKGEKPHVLHQIASALGGSTVSVQQLIKRASNLLSGLSQTRTISAGTFDDMTVEDYITYDLGESLEIPRKTIRSIRLGLRLIRDPHENRMRIRTMRDVREMTIHDVYGHEALTDKDIEGLKKIMHAAGHWSF